MAHLHGLDILHGDLKVRLTAAGVLCLCPRAPIFV